MMIGQSASPWVYPGMAVPAPGGSATPEVQIKHLIRCLQVKDNEIETLQTQLKTAAIELQLSENRYSKSVHVFAEAYLRTKNESKKDMQAILGLKAARKPKWKFWSKQ